MHYNRSRIRARRQRQRQHYETLRIILGVAAIGLLIGIAFAWTLINPAGPG